MPKSDRPITQKKCLIQGNIRGIQCCHVMQCLLENVKCSVCVKKLQANAVGLASVKVVTGVGGLAVEVLVQLEKGSLVNVVLCRNIFTGNIIGGDGVEPLAVGVDLVDQLQALGLNLLLGKSIFRRSTRVGGRLGVSFSGSGISSGSSFFIRRGGGGGGGTLLFSETTLSLGLGSFNADLVTSVDSAGLVKVDNLVDGSKDFRGNTLSLSESITGGGLNSY